MSSSKNTAVKMPENVVKPGMLGRIMRSLTGVFQLYFIFSVLPFYDAFMGHAIPTHSMYWVAVITAFLVLHHTINIGFVVRWGRGSQTVFLMAAALAVIYGLWQYGSFWSPLLNFLIFLLAIYVHTHLGVAHLISGIIATPGCEMRTFSHLRALLNRGQSEARVCPGFWDKLDRWEAARS